MIDTIRNAEQLSKWLVFSRKQELANGIFICSKVRKEFLLLYQNKVVREGDFVTPVWENVGSGCYLCKVPLIK